MFIAYVIRDRLLHLFERSSLGALGKKSAMNVFRSVATGFANDYLVAMAMPFENRTWPVTFDCATGMLR
jgi:hypothetical protein